MKGDGEKVVKHLSKQMRKLRKRDPEKEWNM